MKVIRHMLCTLLMVVLICARAENLPVFCPELCVHRATDILVVDTASTDKGTFRIMEVWQGNLSEGQLIAVPDLHDIAKGKMALFLSRDVEPAKSDKWRPAGLTMATSVVWIDAHDIKAIQQPMNPGPAYAMDLPDMSNVVQLKRYVQLVLDSDLLLKEAKQAKSAKQKVALCSRIINGDCLNKDEALAILGECGEPAVSVLREYVNGLPPSHQRVRAIPALSEAGGKAVQVELTKMLNDELEYWSGTAATLKEGWWFDTEGEAWIRHNRVAHLAAAFRKHPFPPAKSTLVRLRDLFKSTPAIENDHRIGSISAVLSKTIAVQEAKEGSSNKPGAGDGQ